MTEELSIITIINQHFKDYKTSALEKVLNAFPNRINRKNRLDKGPKQKIFLDYMYLDYNFILKPPHKVSWFVNSLMLNLKLDVSEISDKATDPYIKDKKWTDIRMEFLKQELKDKYYKFTYNFELLINMLDSKCANLRCRDGIYYGHDFIDYNAYNNNFTTGVACYSNDMYKYNYDENIPTSRNIRNRNSITHAKTILDNLHIYIFFLLDIKFSKRNDGIGGRIMEFNTTKWINKNNLGRAINDNTYSEILELYWKHISPYKN